MVLKDCPLGREMRLRGLATDRRERLRLLEFGFTPGARLRVIGRCVGGGLMIALGDARIALDAHTGGALVVEPTR